MLKLSQSLSRWLAAHASAFIIAVAIVTFFVPTLFYWVRGTTQTVILGIIMLTMGLTLTTQDFRVLARRPMDILIGACAQFLIMPCVAWLLVRVFRLEPALALGILLVGCCPGGVSSNIMSYLCRGDVAYSVGMTCASTMLAPVMTPLLMQLTAGEIIAIDAVGMFLNILIVTIIPVGIGCFLNYTYSSRRSFPTVQSLMPGVSVTCLACIVGGVISTVHDDLVARGLLLFVWTFAVVLCHNSLGYLLGWTAGRLARFSTAKKRTLSIEVGMQNAGLATVLAGTFFAAQPLAVLPCAISCAWHSISGTILAGLFLRWDTTFAAKVKTNMPRKPLLLIILLACMLTGCSEHEKTYKIAVSQCSQGPWREKVNQEMLAAQHLYEHDVKVTIVESYDDTELQKHQIDSLANSDIDLLVVAPNQAEPLVDAIAKVRAKGIPVIFFDRKADTEDYTAFIGGDNIGAGRAMGNYAVSLGCNKILEVTATMTTSPAQERHEGFESVMKAHLELAYTCIQSDWSTEAAYKVVKQQLAQGKQPDIVFCHSDFMANGAYKAVKEAKLRDKVKILGIDGRLDEGIAYVQKGWEDGSYVYPTHGEKIVKLALDILTGQPYERENLLPSMIVTPENANLEALNSRELIQQNHDLITIHDKLENYFGLYNTQHKMLIVSLITIVLLIVAILMIWRAYVQTRKATKQRQNLNIEETLFYTNSDSRTLRQVFEAPKDEGPAPRSQDTIFAETLNDAIRKHMSNPNLKIEDLGEEVGLSRVQLYRKVKAITGQSPVELLRQMRLQRGYVLLTTTTKTVNEIAYEVGFGTPGYFSGCFKKQFGKYPTEVRTEQGQ